MSAKTAKEAKASYAHLAARAVSDEARALITRIEQLLRDAQTTRRITPRTGRMRLDALERFIGHLLIVRADPAEAGSIYRSLHKGTPDEGPVSLYVFRSVLADLGTADLVTHTPGTRRFLSVGQRFGDGHNQLRATAATFAATDALIALAAKHGIALEDMPQHFVEDAPLLRLSAMATWEYGGRDADGVWYPPRKINGDELSFAETDETQRIRKEVADVVTYLHQQRWGGTYFRGLYRAFSAPHASAVNEWKGGGRLIARGKNAYQYIPSEQRRRITVNWEPTSEIDLSACNLTIFHALMRSPLDIKDSPWERIAIDDREVAKSWVNISLTNGRPLERWPERTALEYEKKYGRRLEADYPVLTVREQAERAFPVLSKLKRSKVSWPDLMYEEGEVMMTTLVSLMKLEVPALPVFDSIIVPAAKEALAARELQAAFEARLGITPRVNIKRHDEGEA